MQCNAVLFDLDGTLIDTIEDIATAMNRVLRSHGFPLFDAQAYRRMVGWGTRGLVERALPAENRDPSLVDQCVKEMVDAYHENPVEKTQPYPNIPELLCILSEKRIPYAVLTNKTDPIAHVVIEQLFDYEQFAFIRGSQPNQPTKPDPRAALEVAAHMQYLPSEVCYVGDSDIDVQTACAAGMYPVGVSWGYRTRDELQEAGAKIILDDPLELVEYVSK
jgi:phosphoglycolate phosphatase